MTHYGDNFKPTVTVTGAKNTKLICIQDDNTADEESDSGAKDCETDDDDPPLKPVTSTSQTQTDLDEQPKTDKSTQREK
nr:unnamed protein product [Callosobruchus chinensis]